MDREARASELVEAWAQRTGLEDGGRLEPRYLWTDAHAVLAALGLLERTGDARWRDLAERTIRAVHEVLGRHREDDPRAGWISGLSETEGRRRPTAGGLRIGKPRPERGPEEPWDARLEWERDGQYFHYLTRWMVALERAAETGERADHHARAVELARAAFRGFTAPSGRPGTPVRLRWKMSIDLSRPLVPSEGHHDPLDGLLTFRTVDAETLDEESAALEAACTGRRWATDDPLGAGGLLVDLLRCARLVRDGLAPPALHDRIARDAGTSVAAVPVAELLRRAPERRLAFRELGLVLGLQALERWREDVAEGRLPAPTEGVPASLEDRAGSHEPLLEQWLRPEARDNPTFLEHRDINEVMLATALVPDRYLG